MRPRHGQVVGVALALSLLVVLVSGPLVPAAADAGPPQPASAPRQHVSDPVPPLVSVNADDSSRLWPYTSRRRSTESATLPINVVVQKNAAYVRYLLITSTDARWEITKSPPANDSTTNQTDVESGVVLNGTAVEWASARGSTRYTYVLDVEEGEGRWISETYQLHDGTYLGKRYHLRLYEGGEDDGQWTAIQAHHEHWDWFRLRHTVDSVDRAQDQVEDGFLGMWFLESMARERYGNGGALDADGWVTVIRLTDRGVVPLTGGLLGVLLLGPFTLLRRRDRPTSGDGWRDLRDSAIDPRYVPLVGLLGVLPVAIRVAGITLERTLPATSPKLIAAALYLVLAVGIPVGTYVLARPLEPVPASVAAASAFGAGMLSDYAYLDIAALPLEVVAHRAVLLVPVALIAAAGGGEGPPLGPTRLRLLVGGGLLWVAGLLLPLLDLL